MSIISMTRSEPTRRNIPRGSVFFLPAPGFRLDFFPFAHRESFKNKFRSLSKGCGRRASHVLDSHKLRVAARATLHKNTMDQIGIQIQKEARYFLAC